ncbi:MAG: calcium/sodium antiporter [Bacteroidaceae bacterium]|nr:calcium/sodium antiporter [Bacteroidaceae bacterium]
MLLNIIFIIVGAVFVLVGADKLTDGAVGLARRFDVPEFVIGLTIVAFGTSLPELVVSLFASISGSPDLSVGNVVGSNIFNTLVIVGGTAIAAPIMVPEVTYRKDIPLTILASIALIALAQDIWFGDDMENELTRGDGIVLLCFFIIFMAYTLSMAKHKDASSSDDVKPMSILRITLYIVFGLVGLIGGGQAFVNGATGIAREAGVSEAVIGLTIVACGTSLPELATSIMAARKGSSGISLGNVIGSNLFNIFFVLGTCSVIRQMPVKGVTNVDYIVMLASAIFFWFYSRWDKRINRVEGFFFLLCFFAYLGWLLYSI